MMTENATTALVTGAAHGIGKAIAQVLAAEGVQVVIADVQQQAAESTARQLRLEGHKALAVVMDVTDASSVTTAVDTVLQQVGSLNTLVNNAGVFQRELGAEVSAADFDRCHSVHIKGAWWVSQALLPHMRTLKSASIINISSVAGRRGDGMLAAYCASKAGLISLTQSLAEQLAPDNITVNAICPGGIATSLQQDLADKLVQQAPPLQPHKYLPLLTQSPLTVEDVAYGVSFFASSRARRITGQTLNIDGGCFMN